MSPLKILINYSFLFWGKNFGLVAEQAHDQKLENFGLFEWNRWTNLHSIDDSKTDDFFADSNIMYDTLYETVLNTKSDTVNDFISNETKIQKIKTYSRFIKQLGLFKIANSDELLQMTKVPGHKRQTLRKINLNANGLTSKTSDHWTLLAEFFHQK